ncbi:AraC family transcriptional regulator [Noviherbaspirillum massiliense]|uniref:AraC family transcriptional regulator n=1 Tax=Noviherbaspirillum massiliense TaxID=1465823 RepID=UPI0002F18DF4|nr:AraC family transcriptional regulator [Noviherbaspirillum massiliense]
MRYSSATDFLNLIKAPLESRGFDAGLLFRQAGLEERECIADDALTLSDKLSHLWELLAHASGDPLLALKLPSPELLDRSGLMGRIMQVSPDISSAIENLVRYTPLVAPTVHSTIERLEDRTRVSLHLPGGRRLVPRQRYDFVWGLALQVVRTAAARSDLRPLLVSYAFPEPEAATAYAEIFGCPVRFGATVNTIEFANADLATPIATADPATGDWTLRMLGDLAQSQRDWTLRMLAKLEQIPVSTFSARVQRLLMTMLESGEPLREEVAKQLMMSERTLQRRLAEEGTNFTKLVDDTRREMAQRYLSNGGMPLKKLSFQLGFSDPSAFSRACKRWFGRSPKQLQ